MVELITLHPKQMISNITRRMWLHNMWRRSHVTQVVVRSLRDLSSLRSSRQVTHFLASRLRVSAGPYILPLSKSHGVSTLDDIIVSQLGVSSVSRNQMEARGRASKTVASLHCKFRSVACHSHFRGLPTSR